MQTSNAEEKYLIGNRSTIWSRGELGSQAPAKTSESEAVDAPLVCRGVLIATHGYHSRLRMEYRKTWGAPMLIVAVRTSRADAHVGQACLWLSSIT